MKNLRATSIDHINMKVKNLEESVKFYQKLFGFEVKQEDNPNKIDAPSKIIGNDSIKLCMYEVQDMSPEGGIAHFGFNIENYDEVLEKCRENGVSILYGGPIDWEKSQSIYIVDPSGYELELSKVSGGGL
ncbi:VOC family protein [Nitrosopumilus sp. K4]|uniref:VOC family protein n=1 Tax=Nitrosopumilus sp. K4 TaxID=2795383 RepID=UPI001BAA65B6|nr:VOC family protein [Nitrosopumilus sp. K4]QUC65536.1 VOC family protein [Nitrosopumilus sp. K4]